MPTAASPFAPATAGSQSLYDDTQGGGPPTSLPVARHPDAVILAVDDQAGNVAILERMLRRGGYSQIVGTTDSRETRSLLERHAPDIVLLDWHMPLMGGLDVLDEITPLLSEDEFLPIVILSADPSPEVRAQALSRGACDFVMKPFDVAEVLLRTRNLLENRRLQSALRRQNRDLEDLLQGRTEALEESHAATLERLARAIECRDDATGQHTHRVAELSARIATALGLDGERVRLLTRAAPLHDLGKIGIPDAILYKPGPLTPGEFALMETHTGIGAQLLQDGHSPITEMAERIARCHHERWDGTGYPDRLAGEQIPLEARIVAVADVFDALTSERPYRSAWSREQALAAVREGSGSQFDPAVVEAFFHGEDESESPTAPPAAP